MSKKIGFSLPVWNEENMLPLWMERVLELKPDMIFIYDDGSTDGTWKLLEKYKEELGDMLYIEKQSDEHTEYFVKSKSEGERLNHHLKVAYNHNIEWLVLMGADEVLSHGASKLLGYIRDGKREWVRAYRLCTWNLYKNLDTYIEKNLTDGAYFFPDFHHRIINLSSAKWYYPETNHLDLTDPQHKDGVGTVLTECTKSSVGVIHLHYLFNESRVRHSNKMVDISNNDLWITKRLNTEGFIPNVLTKWFVNNNGMLKR